MISQNLECCMIFDHLNCHLRAPVLDCVGLLESAFEVEEFMVKVDLILSKFAVALEACLCGVIIMKISSPSPFPVFQNH